MSTKLGPPWIIFQDRGRPVAILPAGRPGEVANVEHLPAERVRAIVHHANALYTECMKARFEKIDSLLDDFAEMVGADVSKMPHKAAIVDAIAALEEHAAVPDDNE